MQAIQFTAPEEIQIIDLPEPSAPGPGETLVRTHRIVFEDVPSGFGKFTDPTLGAIKAIIEVNQTGCST